MPENKLWSPKESNELLSAFIVSSKIIANFASVTYEKLLICFTIKTNRQ